MGLKKSCDRLMTEQDFFVNMAKYYTESGEKWGKVVEKGVASGVHGGVSTYHR